MLGPTDEGVIEPWQGEGMTQAHLERIERELSTILAAWGAGSVMKGGVIALMGHRTDRPQWMNFGRQAAMWGVVDAAIAGAGTISRRRRGSLDDDGVRRQSQRLRSILLINAAADVAYVAGGAVIAIRGRAGRTTWRMGAGDGLAIVVQGAFLLALDTTYAQRLRHEPDPDC